MEVLTAVEMKEADRRAIEEIGIPGPVLMENAARGCFEVIHRVVGSEPEPTMLVLCGGGNNGGDGLAIARHAAIHGYYVTCLLLASEDKLSDDAALQLRILRSFDVEILEVSPDEPDFSSLPPSCSVIVDAMLGTGAKGELRSPYGEATAFANMVDGLKVAVDIPTGLDADTGECPGEGFAADLTVTMAALKPGLLLRDGPELTGEILVADIGTPDWLYQESLCRLIDEEIARDGLPPLDPHRHKYDRGKALVLAGSRDMPGAAVLTATGTISAGAGLVVLGTPESAASRVHPKLPPEIMSLDAAEDDGEFSAEAFEEILERLEKFTLIALGPGIGRKQSTSRFARDIVRRSPLPVILDADGLYAFNDMPDHLAERKAPLVITPHHGEMARLLGVETEMVSNDPLGIARRAAGRFNCIVVLKGSPTVVAEPEGRTWINGTGNPGMATAGTGDVLTGIIAGMTAGRDADDLLPGVLSAVYIHSLAGDLAAEEMSPHGLTSGNLLEYLPNAFRELTA